MHRLEAESNMVLEEARHEWARKEEGLRAKHAVAIKEAQKAETR